MRIYPLRRAFSVRFITEGRHQRLSALQAFGWAKTIAGLAKTKLRRTRHVAHQFTFAMAAYNLIRMPKSLTEGG